MYTPPENLESGARLTQEEIEDAFDTDFGYYVKGINPRRDDNDDRYLLLFANEDGPYGDSVTHGKFEYIGEGLEGDQSESSPGNSALIDAVSSGFPVFFFYTQTESTKWEYQDQVDVIGYQREQRDGRQVLVFEMEHENSSSEGIENTGSTTHGLYLVPISDYWRDKFRASVERPLDLQQYEDVPPELTGIGQLRIWATTETDGDKKQSAIDKMEPGDYILFYYHGEIFSGGRIRRSFESSDVGELIWSQPESRHIYTIDDFTYNVPEIERVWNMIGYDGRQVVQGFTRVANERVANITQEYDSLSSALFGSKMETLPDEEVEDEKSKLEEAIESEPELTENQPEYVDTQRKVRNHAFRSLIRDTYDNTCAVCGNQRETPAGSPEVEAAHIYPKSEGGSDDIRNGLALCKLHHWAFDSGWLSFTDNHEILIADAPDQNGYHEFKRLEGDSLHLPDEEDAHPHPMFLAKHREIYGFD